MAAAADSPLSAYLSFSLDTPVERAEWFIPGEPVTVTVAVTAAEVWEPRAG